MPGSCQPCAQQTCSPARPAFSQVLKDVTNYESAPAAAETMPGQHSQQLSVHCQVPPEALMLLSCLPVHICRPNLSATDAPCSLHQQQTACSRHGWPSSGVVARHHRAAASVQSYEVRLEVQVQACAFILSESVGGLAEYALHLQPSYCASKSLVMCHGMNCTQPWSSAC